MFITWSRLGGRFWSIDQKPLRTTWRARGARFAAVLVRSALGSRWWLALRTLPRGLCSLACRLLAQFMSTVNPTAPSQLPVPTGEVLMEAVGTGPPACRLWAQRFLDWPAEQAVPQIVMNALDPLLVEVIVGADHVDPLISMLRRHYATVRERYPGPFADVERVWGIQREWWLQFVVDEEQSGVSGSAGAGVPVVSDDVLALHRAGPLRLRAAHRSPGRRSAASAPAADADTCSGDSSGTPAAGDAAHHRSRVAADAEAAAASASRGRDSLEPGTAPAGKALPAAPQHASATPVRPRVSGVPGSSGRRPAAAVAGPARRSSPASGAGVSASVSGASGRARPSALHSPARAGHSSIGDAGRRLIDAAYLSPDAVRALLREFSISQDPLDDLSVWRVGQKGFAQLRARLLSRSGPGR